MTPTTPNLLYGTLQVVSVGSLAPKEQCHPRDFFESGAF
jgi:hypothetical protein